MIYIHKDNNIYYVIILNINMNLGLQHLLWKNHDISTYPFFALQITFIDSTLIFFICQFMQFNINTKVTNDGNNYKYNEMISLTDIFTQRNNFFHFQVLCLKYHFTGIYHTTRYFKNAVITKKWSVMIYSLYFFLLVFSHKNSNHQ